MEGFIFFSQFYHSKHVNLPYWTYLKKKRIEIKRYAIFMSIIKCSLCHVINWTRRRGSIIWSGKPYMNFHTNSTRLITITCVIEGRMWGGGWNEFSIMFNRFKEAQIIILINTWKGRQLFTIIMHRHDNCNQIISICKCKKL